MLLTEQGLQESRQKAQATIMSGLVFVNGQRVDIPSYLVKVGDVITIRFGQKALSVEVLSVADNVGKADAAAMYRETTL